MESQPAPAASGVLARLNSHLQHAVARQSVMHITQAGVSLC
jgi:hypothetical protein